MQETNNVTIETMNGRYNKLECRLAVMQEDFESLEDEYTELEDECIVLEKNYDTLKKEHSQFRIQFRVTPAALLSLAFIYSFLIYQILEAMFDFMP